jgi:hypothetical protein
MDRYKVKMACVDHLPDGRLGRGFAERFPGRCYVVSYDVTPNPKDSQVVKVDEDMRHVRVRRTEAIDAMNEMVRSQRNLLPLDLPDGYVEHMQSNVRFVEKDDLGKVSVGYQTKAGADDYAQAEVYDMVATEIWWMRQGIEAIEREVYKPLDDMLEFERSDLGNYEADTRYEPGPGDSSDTPGYGY